MLGHPLIPAVMVKQRLCNGLTTSTMQQSQWLKHFAQSISCKLCTESYWSTNWLAKYTTQEQGLCKLSSEYEVVWLCKKPHLEQEIE